MTSNSTPARQEQSSQRYAHTPIPWKIGYGGRQGDGFATITSPHRAVPVAELSALHAHHGGPSIEADECHANAELIVRAVNSHDNLVETLRGMADWLESFRPAVDQSGISDIEQQWISNARAAIAKDEAAREGGAQ